MAADELSDQHLDPAFATLSADNCDAAFAIHQSSHPNPWSQATFTDCLDPPYFAQQLLNNQQVAGYTIGLNVVGEITLMDIAVAENMRQSGYGKALLSHFISHSMALKGEVIWLEVRQSNSPAIRLYKSFGFEVDHLRKNYYHSSQGKEHAVIMCKRLPDQQGKLIG